jgi:S-methylmethionine-dependent homocysteine/selenocysteine methylase
VRSPRKVRKTYTLSREAVSILEAERKARKAVSSSSALDELLRERQRQNETQRIAASVTSYYDSLSDEDLQEQNLWGEFARSQFPPE